MRPRHIPRPRVLSAVALVAVVALAGHGVSWAAPREGPVLPGAQVGLPEDPARGLRYDGLQPSATGTGRCKTFEMRLASGEVVCTHGPDPAPVGDDVREPEPIPSVAMEDAAVAAAGLACQGDGVSGPRVQLVYARAAGVADRYPALASNFQVWAAQMDDVINQSAAETGGVRHVRFVHDVACQPVVARVQLTNAGDDNLTNTINELRAQGYSRSDRKYLVWVDANIYCGIAQVYEDSRPGSDNPNNGRSDVPGMVARVDSACWGQPNSVETHELVHALGAVQGGAPHATASGHCTDDYDRMCYADGAGVTMKIVCSATGHENRLDCNHDDYFSTAVVPGTWLATHWNTANSAFLTAAGTGTVTTTTTVPPPTTTSTTTTRPPTTTTTTTTVPPATTTTTTTVPPAASSQAARFVDKAYRDILGRAPSGPESTFWQNGLAAGYSRDGMGAQLTTSDEYRRLVVRAWFNGLLGRPASPAELDAVVGYIAAGWSFQQIEAAIASTDEFYRRFGSSPGAYVDALSWLAVGAAPDPGGRAYWVDQLNRGLDRFSVAHAFFTWTAAHQAVVRHAFTSFLDRPADASALAFWTNQLDQGLRQEYVYAYFVGSAEYWSKV